MYSVCDTQLMLSGFPHSEIAGSKVVCHLPNAYRRLPRLSSPLTAKASTVCAYSLDHITPNNLAIICDYGLTCVNDNPELAHLRLQVTLATLRAVIHAPCLFVLLLSLFHIVKERLITDQTSIILSYNQGMIHV